MAIEFTYRVYIPSYDTPGLTSHYKTETKQVIIADDFVASVTQSNEDGEVYLYTKIGQEYRILEGGREEVVAWARENL